MSMQKEKRLLFVRVCMMMFQQEIIRYSCITNRAMLHMQYPMHAEHASTVSQPIFDHRVLKQINVKTNTRP